MKRALRKDTWREIKQSFPRYLSIMAIVMLGVGFFAGLQASSPDMIDSADTYYKNSNLMDIRFRSTLGLSDDDVLSISKLKNIKDIEPSYTLDLIQSGQQEMNVVRVMAIGQTINKPHLMQGRMPKQENECVVEYGDSIPHGFSIGDTITLVSEEDDVSDLLTNNTFTIVGVIENPLYITYQKGSTNVAGGSVAVYIMVSNEVFTMDYYTDVYATLKSTENFVFNSASYQSSVDHFVENLTEWEKQREHERYQQVKNEAQETLDEKKQEAIDELADAKKKLDNAKKKIDDGQKKLNQQRKKADEGFQQVEIQLKQINEQLSNIDQESINTLQITLESLKEKLQQATQAKTLLLESIEKLQLQLSQTNQESEEYTILSQQLIILQEQLQQTETNINLLSQNINTLQQQWDGYQQLLAGKQQCEKILATKKSTYRQLDTAQQTIDKNVKKYDKGLKEYKQSYQEAWDEIEEAQQKIDDIKYPTWYTFTRKDNTGYSEYSDNANRIGAIAKVFPAFFLLIAALVCLTSMTRMVEENRTQIGSYKALGYTNAQIASKYLLYSGSATCIGSIIGLIGGFKIFPSVVIGAYNIMYRFPEIRTPFLIKNAIIALALALATTSFVTWSSVQKELAEVPASLLRPKAPKNGKRILLEQWTWFWKKLSFSRKVTVRNLFRYKKRMIMTIVGIAGCTALMICGFGIHDSITEIGTKQFNKIFKYDMIAILTNEDDALAQYQQASANYHIQDELFAYSTNINLSTEIEATLFVPKDDTMLSTFIDLHTDDGSPIQLQQDSVVISSKMADLMGLNINDTLDITIQDIPCKVKICGICENYANHWIYMNATTYETLCGTPANINQVYLIAQPEQTSLLASELTSNDYVLALSKISDIRQEFNDMISSLNTVVVVLILSAAALALIVLFNLVNINITERIRELATIKVLGFRDGEVTNYLYRENIILTAIGIAIGWGLGKGLHMLVMKTLEINNLVFGKKILLISYIYASLLTILFSIIVNIFTHHSLKKINMIESLKSVE